MLFCRSSTASVSFDKVSVLQTHQQALTLYNPTLIPASFKLFVEGSDSVFGVDPREAWLQPGAEMDVDVKVLLDETQTFKDVLHVLVSEGDDFPVPLQASGAV